MGSVFKRDNSYVIKYKDEHGKWVKKAIGRIPATTKSMAKQILEEIEL